jgi:hypothetical protein
MFGMRRTLGCRHNKKNFFLTATNTTIFNNTQNALALNIINPWFITGFVDAEGSFTISTQQAKWSKLG